MGILKYSTNNSGGGWWLGLKEWKSLEKSGWSVHWVQNGKTPEYTYEWDKILTKNKRSGKDYLGTDVTSAAKEFETAKEGVEEWEKVTRKTSTEVGCNCCGQPHEFTWYKDGEEEYLHLDIQQQGSWNY